MGKYTECIKYFKYAKTLLLSEPDLSNNAALLKLEIDYLNQTKNYTKAAQRYPHYSALNNTLLEHRKTANKIDIGTEFYNLQKDFELNSLKKHYELRKLYLIIAITFTVLLFLFLFQLWRNWLKSRNNNKKLLSLNNQITQQNLNLQETLMALEKSEQENKRVMKVIAHDLRSPIGAIVSLAGLMEDDEELGEGDKHSIGLIKASASSSVKFINELLNRDTGKAEVEKEIVELDALLKYCISLLRFKAAEKNQSITLNSRPIIVNVNREQIWRVVSNLVTNAIKFSNPDSTISLSLKNLNNKIIISVGDKGIGIPEEIQAKIFDASSDIKRQGTSGEKSYGLGLFISKQIVEAHGGKLWFESFPETGTTFFVELPIS